MDQIKRDMRIEVRVRNNLILTAMEKRGIRSIAELCRRLGDESLQSRIGLLINVKKAARADDGSWDPLALRLADFFYCLPEDLFSEAQQYDRLERNKAIAAFASDEMLRLAQARQTVSPETAVQAQELRLAVRQALRSLSPREERIIRWRFGFDDDRDLTFSEISRLMGISQERIRMIEAKALRTLRHPAHSRKIKAACADRGGRDWNFDRRVIDAL